MPQQPKIGDDVTALMPQVGEDVTSLMASHEPTPPVPEHPHARTWRLVKPHLPLIGGAIGAALTGGASLPVQALAAGAGGAVGATARGDSPTQALTAGAVEGGTQALGGLAVKVGGRVARGLMKGTVPKNIAKEYDDVDIAQEMLDRGVVPGSEMSARRVGRLSTAANAEREAAAQTVPAMPRSRVIGGLRPLHAEAVAAKEPEIAADMLAYMRDAARNIGPEGLDGAGQLARKTVKQRQGRAALNAGSSKEAAVLPQAAEAERAAITAHLRETPRMATALNESQALMAIDDVMRDAAHSNPITRGRIGGATAASMTPIGLGLTAHAVNQGSRVVDPQILRAMQLAILRGDQ